MNTTTAEKNAALTECPQCGTELDLTADYIRSLQAHAQRLAEACKIALDRLEAFNPEIKTPVTQKTLREALAQWEGSQQ